MGKMMRIINMISHIGINDEIPEGERRFIILINTIAVLFIFTAWIYIPLVILYIPNANTLLIVLFCHGLFFLLIPLLNSIHLYLMSRIFFGLSAALFLGLESLLTGPEADVHNFFLAAILVPFFIYPPREKIYMYFIVALFLSCYGFINYWYAGHDPLERLTNPDVVSFARASSKIGLAVTITAVTVYAHAVLRNTEKKLEIEHRKAEDLLLNILPEKIADRLKEGADSIADGFEYVSILFADIVGFTEMSEKTTPDRLVKILNELFSRYDDLIDRYGLEKIKTIGDAYMVAAGIPEPMENHAVVLLEFAGKMITETESFNSKYGTNLNIRIGINSGSVVAGVIGKKKFIYDLWGDSVNIASRMESQGVPGEIQVSEYTYKLVKDRFRAKKSHEILVKGKGKMKAYIIDRGGI